MLRRLYINNFALIKEMEVRFPEGLTVITGETGAGKSIFLEALGLALGKRADAGVLGTKDRKCIVEAEFEASPETESVFRNHDLDVENIVILRRELSPEGRSRSLVNDSVVSLQALKDFASVLLDLHSQHQTLELGEGRFQVQLLDAFAGNQTILQEYRQQYQQLVAARRNLDQLLEKQAESLKEQDYNRFVLSELQAAALEPGKHEAVSEEAKRLENLETIRGALLEGANLLNEGENPVLNILAQVKQSISSVANYGESYLQLAERLQSVYVELKDIAGELQREGESLHSDEKRLDELSQYLDKVSRLAKKHRVQGEGELLALLKEYESKLLSSENMEAEIAGLQKQIVTIENSTKELAVRLSEKRNAAAPKIEKLVRAMLDDLAMQNAVLKISVEKGSALHALGQDKVNFLFRANKGEGFAELQKVASGGELSRLMLCLKSLLAEKKNLPAIIFDEIDTGVSGEVAGRIGAILENMSSKMQVIAITHLPQMASRGHHHLYVFKKDEADRTISFIRKLEGEERIKEIAKMLSSGKPGESALQNARELLSLQAG